MKNIFLRSHVQRFYLRFKMKNFARLDEFTTPSIGKLPKMFSSRSQRLLYHCRALIKSCLGLCLVRFKYLLNEIDFLSQLYNKLGYSVGSVHPRALRFHSQKNQSFFPPFFRSLRILHNAKKLYVSQTLTIVVVNEFMRFHLGALLVK